MPHNSHWSTAVQTNDTPPPTLAGLFRRNTALLLGLFIPPVDFRKLLVDRTSRESYHLGKLVKVAAATACIVVMVATALLAGTAFVSAHQVSGDEHMCRRIVLPVVHEIIYVPQGKLVNLAERPSGSSSDMAV